MTATGSRDHLWLLAGAAALVVVVAITGLLTARADEKPEADRRPAASAGETAPPVTKADRVPAGALMPNLVVLPADELGITGRGDRRSLRFASVLANDGTGPLQIDPVPDEVCAPDQRYVEQRVFVDGDGDGMFDRRRDLGTVALPGGCMVFHPRHEHWHFDSSAGYALTTVEDDELIVATEKVSFCLRDSEPLRSATERQARAYEDCARNRRQGITVGWGDRYDATLSGQRLRLPPGFADGAYCLRLEVDPLDLLREENEDDNTSAVVVQIRDREVTRGSAGPTC